MFNCLNKKGVRSKFLERRAARERIQGFLDFSPSRIITRLSRTILLLRPLINTRRRNAMDNEAHRLHSVCSAPLPPGEIPRFSYTWNSAMHQIAACVGFHRPSLEMAREYPKFDRSCTKTRGIAHDGYGLKWWNQKRIARLVYWKRLQRFVSTHRFKKRRTETFLLSSI